MQSNDGFKFTLSKKKKKYRSEVCKLLPNFVLAYLQ